MRIIVLILLLTVSLLAQVKMTGKTQVGSIVYNNSADESSIRENASGKLEIHPDYTAQQQTQWRDDIGDSVKVKLSATLESFGAVGDGVTNDYTALQNAFNSGLKLYGTSGKTYYYEGAISVTGKDVTLMSDGKNPFYLVCGTSSTLSVSGEITTDTTTLSATVYPNQKSIDVVSSSAFSVGDLIKIMSTKNDDWIVGHATVDRRLGEMNVISYISGNTLYLEHETYGTYDITDTTFNVIRVDPVKVEFTNFELRFNSSISAYVSSFWYLKDSKFTKFSVKNGQRGLVLLYLSYNTKFDNCYFSGANETSLGYAIWSGSSTLTKVTNSIFHNNMKAFDVSAHDIPNLDATFANNYVNGGGLSMVSGDLSIVSRGASSHAFYQDYDIHDNIFSNLGEAVYLAGVSSNVKNNIFRGRLYTSAISIVSGGCVNITNNSYDPKSAGRDTVINGINHFVLITGTYVYTDSLNYINIKNNTVVGTPAFINSGVGLNNLNVQNNNVALYSGSGSTVRFIYGAVTYSNSNIFNNDVSVINGSYEFSNSIFDSSCKLFYDDQTSLYTSRGIKFTDGAILKKIALYPTTADSIRFIITNSVSSAKDTSDWIGVH